MATCNDCLHNEMCYGTHTDDSPTCCDFKDKSRFIELPCKVGDTVYEVMKKYKYPVCKRGLGKTKDNCSYECPDCNEESFEWIIQQKKATDYVVDVLIRSSLSGEKCDYFLTKEEAEKALKLKEREQE